jgi:hypothetical protein
MVRAPVRFASRFLKSLSRVIATRPEGLKSVVFVDDALILCARNRNDRESTWG